MHIFKNGSKSSPQPHPLGPTKLITEMGKLRLGVPQVIRSRRRQEKGGAQCEGPIPAAGAAEVRPDCPGDKRSSLTFRAERRRV